MKCQLFEIRNSETVVHLPHAHFILKIQIITGAADANL